MSLWSRAFALFLSLTLLPLPTTSSIARARPSDELARFREETMGARALAHRDTFRAWRLSFPAFYERASEEQPVTAELPSVGWPLRVGAWTAAVVVTLSGIALLRGALSTLRPVDLWVALSAGGLALVAHVANSVFHGDDKVQHQARLLYNEAFAAVHSNRSAEAFKLAEQLLALEPSNFGGWKLYTKLLIDQGRHDAAKILAFGMTAWRPENVAAWELLSEAFGPAANSLTLVALSERAAVLESDNPQHYITLGQLYARVGQPVDALMAYRASAKAGKQAPTALLTASTKAAGLTARELGARYKGTNPWQQTLKSDAASYAFFDVLQEPSLRVEPLVARAAEIVEKWDAQPTDALAQEVVDLAQRSGDDAIRQFILLLQNRSAKRVGGNEPLTTTRVTAAGHFYVEKIVRQGGVLTVDDILNLVRLDPANTARGFNSSRDRIELEKLWTEGFPVEVASGQWKTMTLLELVNARVGDPELLARYGDAIYKRIVVNQLLTRALRLARGGQLSPKARAHHRIAMLSVNHLVLRNGQALFEFRSKAVYDEVFFALKGNSETKRFFDELLAHLQNHQGKSSPASDGASSEAAEAFERVHAWQRFVTAFAAQFRDGPPSSSLLPVDQVLKVLELYATVAFSVPVLAEALGLEPAVVREALDGLVRSEQVHIFQRGRSGSTVLYSLAAAPLNQDSWWYQDGPSSIRQETLLSLLGGFNRPVSVTTMRFLLDDWRSGANDIFVALQHLVRGDRLTEINTAVRAMYQAKRQYFRPSVQFPVAVGVQLFTIAGMGAALWSGLWFLSVPAGLIAYVAAIAAIDAFRFSDIEAATLRGIPGSTRWRMGFTGNQQTMAPGRLFALIEARYKTSGVLRGSVVMGLARIAFQELRHQDGHFELAAVLSAIVDAWHWRVILWRGGNTDLRGALLDLLRRTVDGGHDAPRLRESPPETPTGHTPDSPILSAA